MKVQSLVDGGLLGLLHAQGFGVLGLGVLR